MPSIAMFLLGQEDVGRFSLLYFKLLVQKMQHFVAPGKINVNSGEVSTIMLSFGIGATFRILQKTLWSPVCMILLGDIKRVKCFQVCRQEEWRVDLHIYI